MGTVSVLGTHSGRHQPREPLPTSALPPLRRCRQTREPLVGAPAAMRCVSSRDCLQSKAKAAPRSEESLHLATSIPLCLTPVTRCGRIWCGHSAKWWIPSTGFDQAGWLALLFLQSPLQQRPQVGNVPLGARNERKPVTVSLLHGYPMLSNDMVTELIPALLPQAEVCREGTETQIQRMLKTHTRPMDRAEPVEVLPRYRWSNTCAQHPGLWSACGPLDCGCSPVW